MTHHIAMGTCVDSGSFHPVSGLQKSLQVSLSFIRTILPFFTAKNKPLYSSLLTYLILYLYSQIVSWNVAAFSSVTFCNVQFYFSYLFTFMQVHNRIRCFQLRLTCTTISPVSLFKTILFKRLSLLGQFLSSSMELLWTMV